MTPLLKQYIEIKKEYQDAILLFHIGDFYETFYEDAEIASRVLDITLTSKPMGKGVRVPLAGIPVKAADSYIDKLVKEGYKVAVADQVEDPSESGKLVKREVIEVITSGTVMRPSLLDETDNNYIASILKSGERFGIAFSDISTGEFKAGEIKEKNLKDEVMRLSPVELIVPRGHNMDIPEGIPETEVEVYKFDEEYALEEVKDHFNVVTVESFGIKENSPGVRCAGALISYLYDTQKRALSHINSISRFSPENNMILDAMTIKNLEIIQKIGGERKGSMINTVDDTLTSIGSRLLKKWLLYPLIEIEDIEKRQDGVEELLYKRNILNSISEILSRVYDVERITGRISTNRATPRDLISLKESLISVMNLKEELNSLDEVIFRELEDMIKDMNPVISMIEEAIVDDPPVKITEGGIFKDDFNEELDRVRKIASEGKKWVIDFEKKQKEETGIESLKVGYNSVFGYYIEVTKANLDKVPEHYVKKQTLTNSERFITEQLKDFESEILGAEEKQKNIEYTLFNEMIEKMQEHIKEFEAIAKSTGTVDILGCFARNSLNKKWVRPKVNKSKCINIKNGRHPVVEELLSEGEFIPNDTDLKDRERVVILTGPNMSGKSTYLRQIAEIVILAQVGSFVPAEKASIGLVDRVFTRIGASDDLTRGISTFLAEMNETANILHNVTGRSLVLLDEIGRGTSTYDGLAIAWSVVEYLQSLPEIPYVLFATHFHELTELEEYYDEVINYNVSVKETENDVIFLRTIKKGASDRSYGVEVARLAGLPESVIERARELLEDLLQDDRIVRHHPPPTRQLKLFDKRDILIDKIKSVKPDELSPKKALDIIYRLKEEADEI